MIPLLCAVAVLALLVCLVDVRAGAFVCLAAGFGAELVRKTVPGEPVWISALVIVFAAALFVGLWWRFPALRIPFSAGEARRIRTPLRLFLALVVAEAAAGLAATRSPVVAGIGMLAYLAPLPAVIVAHRIGRRLTDLSRFLWSYVALAALFVSGVFLSALGSPSPLLRAVGDELIVYSARTGEPVRLLSGFFRSSEIAAWHAGAAFCLLVVLWVAARKGPLFHVGATLLALFLLGGILLTGRRKALALIVVFLAVYGILAVRFRRGAGRLATAVLVFAVAGGVLFPTVVFRDLERSAFRPYIERSASTSGREAWNRLRNISVGSFGNIVARNGFFGAGAGTGSQGSQYYGGGTELVGSGAEGGFGKVLAELGIPGLALLAWTIAAIGRAFWRAASRASGERARTSLGLIAFLVAALVEFTTAHQAFGDPFVLLTLGCIVGFLAALAESVAGKEMPSAARAGVSPVPETSRGGERAAALPIDGIRGWNDPWPAGES